MIYYKGLKKLQAFLKKGENENVDIMDELQKCGCDTTANQINKFFKSRDGRKFYKKNVVGNQGYWRLKEIIKQK